mmetsp:Transcript_35417/g.87017  ORF Transcript_35417/g.87017 Transcript_35417/m.87017 type:complete len:316 (+) Transcript_35417:352-1299(+)
MRRGLGELGPLPVQRLLLIADELHGGHPVAHAVDQYALGALHPRALGVDHVVQLLLIRARPVVVHPGSDQLLAQYCDPLRLLPLYAGLCRDVAARLARLSSGRTQHRGDDGLLERREGDVRRHVPVGRPQALCRKPLVAQLHKLRGRLRASHEAGVDAGGVPAAGGELLTVQAIVRDDLFPDLRDALLLACAVLASVALLSAASRHCLAVHIRLRRVLGLPALHRHHVGAVVHRVPLLLQRQQLLRQLLLRQRRRRLRLLLPRPIGGLPRLLLLLRARVIELVAAAAQVVADAAQEPGGRGVRARAEQRRQEERR